MSVRVGVQDCAVGSDHFSADQVVARQTVLAVEPAESAAECEPGDSGDGNDAERGGEPMLLRAAVELAEQQTGPGADGALGGSICTVFSGDRSRTTPSSHTALPA